MWIELNNCTITCLNCTVAFTRTTVVSVWPHRSSPDLHCRGVWLGSCAALPLAQGCLPRSPRAQDGWLVDTVGQVGLPRPPAGMFSARWRWRLWRRWRLASRPQLTARLSWEGARRSGGAPSAWAEALHVPHRGFRLQWHTPHLPDGCRHLPCVAGEALLSCGTPASVGRGRLGPRVASCVTRPALASVRLGDPAAAVSPGRRRRPLPPPCLLPSRPLPPPSPPPHESLPRLTHKRPLWRQRPLLRRSVGQVLGSRPRIALRP